MTLTTLGDLARHATLTRQNTSLKAALTQLSTEVSTGLAADTSTHLNGHLTHLSRIEHDMAITHSYAVTTAEASVTTAAMQEALGQIGQNTENLLGTLALATGTAGSSIVSVAAQEGRAALDSVIAAMNLRVADRHLFAGIATDTAPLASGDQLLSELKTALAGALTPEDIAHAADAFFDTPGGVFETAIYQGADQDLAELSISAREQVSTGIRADSSSLREVLKHLALTSLADAPELSLDTDGRQALLKDQLDGVIAAQDGLTNLQAELGIAQKRIEDAGSRHEAELSALNLAKSDLLAKDPYDTATEFEAVRQQLETLYSVTVRMSRLNLSAFLS